MIDDKMRDGENDHLVNLTYYREVAKQDNDFFDALLAQTVESLEQFSISYPYYFSRYDHRNIVFVLGKIESIITKLEINKLKELFDTGKRIGKKRSVSNLTRERHIEEVLTIVSEVINSLNEIKGS